MICLRCAKPMKPSMPDGDDPNDGVTFIAYGNYGSTIYDPPPAGGQFIRIYICDDCLRKKSHWIEHVTIIPKRSEYRVQPFDPSREY